MVTLVTTAFLCPRWLFAQAPEAPPAASTGPALRQTLTLEATIRRYRVGESRVAEEAAPLAYQLVAGGTMLRLSAAPVGFSAAATAIRGSTPFSARLDHRFAGGSAVRLYGQTASAPGTLDARETSALGTVGTPTLDLESLSLGTPALLGVRAAHDLTGGPAVVTVHGAVEVQPRPSGNDPVYWRGRTVRGGVAVEARAGDSRFIGGVEASRSSADALDGRNLFPGGGTISVTASGSGPIADDSLTFWQLFGFYFRPLNSSRPDQPNRLIPVGDFMAIHGSLSIPTGPLLLWPSVDVSREASRSESQSARTQTRIDGSGWTANTALSVTVPLGRGLDLAPSAGYVFGLVAASLTTTSAFLETRDAFSDPIRGRWFSLELSVRF